MLLPSFLFLLRVDRFYACEEIMAHILVVDDEESILNSVCQILEDAGHTTCRATCGQAALDVIERQTPDLVVLDVIMPEMDGVEVCRRLRANPFLVKLPVLFLTARGRPSDVARGLDAGGDDYLIKPFDAVELPARIRALLRRTPGGSLNHDVQYLTIGRLRVHETRLEAYVDDHLIRLTPTEHRLLQYLVRNIGHPVPVEQLLSDIWEYPPGVGDPKLARVHIANLRAKLELKPDDPEYIHNQHGHGYLIYK
jgi:DNA-binding response OmpR family regulator